MTRMIRAAGTVAALLILAACGSGPDDGSGTGGIAATSEAEPTATTTSTPAAEPAIVQLCDVLRSAVAGELDEVRKAFDHGPLHTLADAAIEVDRSVAARLLRAKEAVESDLADPSLNAEHITTDLRELTDAAAEASAVTGATTEPSCEDNP